MEATELWNIGNIYHLTQHNIPEDSGLHVDKYIVKSNRVLRLDNSHHLTQLSS